jgi:hypothetical protein
VRDLPTRRRSRCLEPEFDVLQLLLEVTSDARCRARAPARRHHRILDQGPPRLGTDRQVRRVRGHGPRPPRRSGVPTTRSRTRNTSITRRALWIESLGMTAVLPPPEERRQVKTAIGAARAEQSAEKARGPNSVVAPGDGSSSNVAPTMAGAGTRPAPTARAAAAPERTVTVSLRFGEACAEPSGQCRLGARKGSRARGLPNIHLPGAAMPSPATPRI